jgi:urea carboxylase-associated protein 2
MSAGADAPPSQTGTTVGARDHARAQADTVVEAMPIVPARDAPDIPEGVDPARMTWSEIVAGGGYTSKVLARGTALRLTDRDGEACAHLLLYNADQPWERLNMADTVKVPWQAYLGDDHPLLSDQGRVLATIASDDAGDSHDALCGTSTRALNERRYGDGSVHGLTPAGRELLRVAAAKHGLEPRDIPPSLSLFKRVRVGGDGQLLFSAASQAGAAVTLIAELPLIVLVANTTHPLDPRESFTCSALEVQAWRHRATTPADELWSLTPELERAFRNTADYLYARGVDV